MQKPLGTGFFVGVPIKDKIAVYLVTARHVLERSPDNYHEKIYLRLNKKDGTAEFEEVILKDIKIHTHSDKSIDIAIFFCGPSQEEYDFTYLEEALFATNEVIENRAIAEGDEVFFEGLFSKYSGRQKNEPILRFGKVSLMTNEKIEVDDGQRPKYLAHLYLFECQSLGGFSGAPVFYVLSPFRYNHFDKIKSPKAQIVYLAGIMKGHYNQITTEMNDTKIRELHEGIAMVTPCHYLKEIVNGESATNERTMFAEKL